MQPIGLQTTEVVTCPETWQESHNCSLAGAVSLCNPFNLPIADEGFHKGFNNTYDKALASSLRRIFKKHGALFEDIGGEYNIPMAANAKTVREFDEGLTRVSFGIKSADDYYLHSSSSDSIKHVFTPLLCIQAANDLIAPARGIPRKDIEGYVQKEMPYSDEELEETREQWANYFKNDYLMDGG
ncbi:embryogenesis-associated protein EMB8-like isoform X1 [Spinacia oleracea]|uniref:Embryogenesis-associated protein EMB8-like isoform X1 n=1 Tax=Spinacia oleracea TaxID=3562 RepID=A0ABM3QGE6_SPIOL|nr:embryogenesis-associated protein EMB8-like isoform X1 [Spinacia oleracea]XP_056682436.1 embryogenesis-associated protein EMB8-like isoform X1 [Spinacia oleracea]